MLWDATAIRETVFRLAAEIDRDLDGRPAVLVGVLKGSVFFLSDLARRIQSPIELDFLRIASYGDGTRSSGIARVLHDVSADIAGRDVILVEDIVETGKTIEEALSRLRARRPKSLKVCSLLRKTLPGRHPAELDYVGFDVDDRFVVGYGMDHAESYRNLPYIAAIEELRRAEMKGGT